MNFTDLSTKYVQPKLRLGYQGAHEIKNHPFFSDINWEYLYQKKYEPPFKPRIAHSKDLRHFDKQFTEEEVMDTPNYQQVGGHNQTDQYENFTYVP